MKKALYTIAALALFWSCNDWINEAPKTDYMGERELFSSEDAFRNYLNGIYSHLRSADLYGSHLTLGGVEFLGQTLRPDAALQGWSSYDFTGEGASAMIAGIYEGLYEAISSCNNLLSLLDRRDDVLFVSGSRQMMKGEALALRAYLHFELARLFNPSIALGEFHQGIVWMDSIDGKPVRMTTRQLMEEIITELHGAIELLRVSDPIITGVSLNTSSLDGTRIVDRQWKMNYYGATGIKARVHMCLGQYAQASRCAKAIYRAESISDIVGGVEQGSRALQFPLASTLSGTDRAFSREHIFGYASAQDESVQMSLPALSNSLFYDRAIGVDDRITASLSLLPADDKRLIWFNGAGTGMGPKFGGTTPGSESNLVFDWNVPQRMPALKVGEMYLLDAEATLYTEGPAPAMEILDEYMAGRVSSIAWSPDPSPDEILRQIIVQYELELIGEGQLFHIHKRMNSAQIGAVAMTSEKYTLPTPRY